MQILILNLDFTHMVIIYATFNNILIPFTALPNSLVGKKEKREEKKYLSTTSHVKHLSQNKDG